MKKNRKNNTSPRLSGATLYTLRVSRGIVTLELLIAFALAVILLTGATLVSFGGQTSALDTSLTGQGLPKTSTRIQAAVLGAYTDWSGTAAGTEITLQAGGDVYDETKTVTDISECMKGIGIVTDWKSEQNRGQHLGLQTLVGNVPAAQALGGDCDPFPPGDWDTPDSYGFTPPSVVDGQGSSVAVAAINGTRYAFLTTINSDSAKKDIWVFNAADPQGSLSPVAMLNTGPGIIDIVIARNPANSRWYAYIINDDIADQLKVVDISDPVGLSLSDIKAVRSLPDTTGAIGRSIYYYDRHIYIGTQYLPCPVSCTPTLNHEFHVFSVIDPTSPVWEGSIDVDRNVNSIAVRDGLAYLATGPGSSGTNNPLKIYDILSSSPTYLQPVSSFTAVDTNDQAGTSSYLLGEKLYLGLQRATATHKDFYVLDVPKLSLSPIPSDVVLGAIRLEDECVPQPNCGLNPGNAITGIQVQGPLAFIGTTYSNASFQVWDISEPASIHQPSTCDNYSFPQDVAKIKYNGNMVFTAIRSNEALRVIYDTPDFCPAP